jgi:SAM-dependent methyltransferase
VSRIERSRKAEAEAKLGAINWYDEALYYDVLCSWDPGTEREFVLGASERWGIAQPQRILEPFCGSGRLLRCLPQTAIGFDLNPAMVRYAAQQSLVFRADAGRFAVRAGSFDLALCLIDSFRHLTTHEAALGHMRSIAGALRPGAVYVLGLDVTGGMQADTSTEDWEMTRGDVRVAGTVGGLGDVDPNTRIETMRVQLDIRDRGKRRKIESFQPLRVYSAQDLQDLFREEGSFEAVACFDRRYNLEDPRPLDSIRGSAVLVLRRKQRDCR